MSFIVKRMNTLENSMIFHGEIFGTMKMSGMKHKTAPNIRGENGLIDYTASCNICGNWFHYDTNFDAYFCDPCDEWVSKKCTDTEFRHCDRRPPRPSHVLPMKKSL